jgi:hypothetical protein
MGTFQDDDGALVSDATREEERREARVTSNAGRGPTPEEEQAAERTNADPDVARENKAAAERGAHVRGEGQID